MPPHRADIKTPKLVIELQHSLISAAMIREREAFYGDMIWLFDLRKVKRNILISDLPASETAREIPYHIKLIAWLHARRSVFACTKPVVIALERGLIYNIFGFGFYSWLGGFQGGFAQQLTKQQFLEAVGACPPVIDHEPAKLYDFNSMPCMDVAKRWIPYWHDERVEHWNTPTFTIRSHKPDAPKIIRIVQLPAQHPG